MSNESLQVRFTDEKYSMRIDVARALGTNLIDGIWNNILEYRKKFSVVLPIKDISKMPLSLTLGKKVNDLSKDVEAAIARLDVALATQPQTKNNAALYAFTHEMKRLELSNIARLRNIQVNDIAIGNIISKRAVDMNFNHLVNYFNALEHINPVGKITTDLLAEFYSKIVGQPELTTFYRTSSISSQSERVMIDRQYASAPASDIEEMMNGVISLANSNSLPYSVRAVLVYYLVNYIKPFEKYNEEMAVIFAKLIMPDFNKTGYIKLLPLERMATQRTFEYSSICRDIQKNKDTTYVVILLLEVILETVQNALDRLAVLSVQKAGQVYYAGEEKKNSESVEEEKHIEVVKVQPKVEEQEVKPVAPVKTSKKEKEQPIIFDRYSVPTSTEEVSEKELKRRENDMLESDPTLKVGQAKFYVRHCTPGKYYTIEQYKKAIGCVYETARTSMDNLAKKGYYQREKVNNKKFVYTPISK